MTNEAIVDGSGPIAGTTSKGASTNGLLRCGVAIAPLFFAVVFGQAFTRAGFDLRRAPLSLLSLGDLGWIQIANFIVTGLLGLACAIGMRQFLKGSTGGTGGRCSLAHLAWASFWPDSFIRIRVTAFHPEAALLRACCRQ